MMFYFHKGIIKCTMRLCIVSFFLSFSLSATPTLNYNGLFDELSKYKKTEAGFHQGHLLEHMVWVAKAMDKLFDEKKEFFSTSSVWMQHCKEPERRMMVIAAFLHDIGKAGDLKYQFFTKIPHPCDGFEMLMGEKPFLLNADGRTFDMQAYINQLELTEHEFKTVAVLVGMHQELGKMFQHMKTKDKSWNSLYQKFLDDLQEYVTRSGYNNGVIDERIIWLSAALCRADCEGLFYVDHEVQGFPELVDLKPTLLDATRPLGPVFFDIMGYPLFVYGLLRYFHAQQGI